ncbi:hypothetical protein AAG570_009469 [Ranatra chinensis]|uniref:RNA methyltransferase n=1 Tax=Ranatra chinensis TaxID=642074 RepID=A0ABD0Z692_9HEMI
MPYKKHKQQPEENKHKCCRKKPQHSFGGGNGQKPFPQHKKRKQFIPPTKFLLGGNINDPLNLNSLQDEEINRYYGYRNLNHEVDPRLKLLVNRRELFEGRDVLDVGCNTGHITVSIARDLGARTVVGLDLDRSLVDAARANLRRHRPHTTTKQFPLSMPVTYGPLDVPGIHSSTGFPNNISFVQGNYVLQSDVLVELEQPQFDVILCLSVTKWLHLNWGDAGLKRAFKRMFAQLRPGGTLILEPQSWTSYKRKKNLTEAIWKNYQMIKLFPPKFTQYLLTEVGFSKCEVIGAPLHQSRGFQRPIKVFTKGETPLSSRTPADRREVEEERKTTEINDNTVGMETNDTKDSDSSEVLGRLSGKLSNLGYLEGNNGNSSNSMDIENKVKTKLLTKSPTNITEGECATESSILKHSCVKRKMSESELSIDDSISAKRLLTECKVEALQNKPSCDPHTIQNISNGFVLTKENSLKQSSEGETLEGTEIINSNKTVENNGKPGERSENGSER